MREEINRLLNEIAEIMPAEPHNQPVETIIQAAERYTPKFLTIVSILRRAPEGSISDDTLENVELISSEVDTHAVIIAERKRKAS